MKHPFRLAAVSAAVLSLHSSFAIAAEELATVVVTATRTPTRTNDVLSDVSVVDREQIERSGTTTLYELLSTLPGIQFTSNGGRGASGSMFMRGANNNQTLVLIDGQRIASATTGSTALEHLPLEQIERIEVVRGPASALYGSDAIGGVVQIFTRTGEGTPKPNFGLGFGSYNTRTATVGYGGKIGDTSFSLQAGWDDSDSFSSIRQAKGGTYDMFNPDKDGYRNGNWSAKIGHKISSDLSVGAEVLQINTLKHFDSSNCDSSGSTCTANYDNRQRQELTSYAAHATYRISPAWTSMLRLGQSQDKMTNYKFDPTTTPRESLQHYNTTQDQVVWQNDFTLSPANKLMASLEWRQVHVNSTQTFVANDQTTRSVVLGYQGRLDAHSVQASVRNDSIERLGSHRTGSLSYGYHFLDAWTARAGLGTAFHAPTFNDLYWPLDTVNFFQGNPNLKPEKSRNREIGLRYERGNTAAGLTVYENKVRNLIDYVSGVAPTWIGTYNNISRATLQGASFDYTRRSGNWESKVVLDTLRATNDATGKTLQRRAGETGTVEVRRHIGDASVGMQIQGVGKRYNNATNTQVLHGYSLVNLDGTVRIDRDWSVMARLNNLFDRNYTLVQSTMSPYNEYATPGRNFYVGLRYSPK